MSVGVIAPDPRFSAGGITADAAEQVARFVDLRDQFRLPVVNLVDQPGFVVGTEDERAGTSGAARGSLRGDAVAVRSARGASASGSRGAAHGDGSRLNQRWAWPSGKWGSLPITGGLEAAFRRELEAADDPAALRAEIEARLRADLSPSARPRSSRSRRSSTRPLLCAWASNAARLAAQDMAAAPPIRLRGYGP